MIPRHERAVFTFKEDRIVVGGVHKLSTEHRAECSFKGGIACKTFSLLISLGFLVYPVMKGALAKQCVTRDGDDPNASVADRGACRRGRCGTAVQHRSLDPSRHRPHR